MIKHNPYNWGIEKKRENIEMKMPYYPGVMDFRCILDELTQVSNELEITRLKYDELKRDFENTEKQLSVLESRKEYLIKKISK